jgi:hypothetical protein
MAKEIKRVFLSVKTGSIATATLVFDTHDQQLIVWYLTLFIY